MAGRRYTCCGDVKHKSINNVMVVNIYLFSVFHYGFNYQRKKCVKQIIVGNRFMEI